MKTRLPHAAAIFAALGLATVAVYGQPAKTNSATKPQPAAKATPKGAPTGQPANTDSIEVSDSPFHLKSVGLTLHLPVGVQSQITGTADQSSAQVMAADSTWLINIQTPVSKNTKATPDTVAAEVRDQLLAAAGIVDRTITRDGVIKDKGNKDGQPSERLAGTKAEIVQDVKALLIPGVKEEEARPAARFYVKLPGAEKQQAVIRGYTIFMVSPGHFVTFDLMTPEANFAKARVAYETTIATARFTDPTVINANRGAAIESGNAFLQSLSPADYDAAIASLNNKWYRQYKPAPTGADSDAKEIAYRHMQVWKGKRGQLDPKRPEAKWSAEDKQDGYLVKIEHRILDEHAVIDSVGLYFMSADRKDEAWNLRMVVRDSQAKHPTIWQELGARNGLSMSVQTEGSGESKVGRPQVPQQGYMNQVEGFLLPSLLIHTRKADDKGHAGEFGFYWYQSQSGTVHLRTESLGEAQDRAGAWKLQTQLNEDRAPQTGVYNERGELVELRMADDSVWVPTTPQRLMDIWKAKGLPTDTPEAARR